MTSDDAFLLVADFGNPRVVVLRASDGSWVRALTGSPGTLQYPWGVAVAPSGEVLVTDVGRHVVICFRSIEDDAVAGTLGTGLGSGPAQLHDPSNIALVDDNQVRSLIS